mmetsp:Transcript_28463/g.65990  ORF Transcript_28463/g.65990 Transcript_28463/m.65990 type:complete len:704 (-) Transcript_28463:268-2379(-)
MDKGYDVYEYSRKGDLESLREAIDEGSKPDDYMAYDGSTALVMAARNGHGHIVKELLARGADPQVRTEDGSTMLHHAASGNTAEAVTLLIRARIDPNEGNEEGLVPLILAAHYGHLACVRALCSGGADVNLAAEGWGTPLDGAEGEVAAFLVGNGAKRSAQGADQPLASAHERFSYGCFESGENPHSTPVLAPGSTGTSAAKVGDHVRLRFAKPSGMLKEGDIGVVVADDGSDCVPLKVAMGDRYDYYEYADVMVCEPADSLPPDSAHATPDGTKRLLVRKKLEGANVRQLGKTGLHVSPVGFGCHRLEDSDAHRASLELAISLGCNFVDLAPNYTDGVAEQVAGEVLNKMLQSRKVRRDEIIIATKVGNVLGKQLAFASGVPNMTKINDGLCHCISPAWIEQELTRSLERLKLSCIDCLLLHCPEYESKAADVDLAEVYNRMRMAFQYLETEVARGRIVSYGVSAAFMPLRPTDPEHLDLAMVMKQLPANHHFRALQFPLNFAEAQAMWVGHVPRNPDGSAVDSKTAVEALTLFEAAKSHGLATFINRPLDGIYKEAHGVLRFSSLDCDVRSYSELQLDNCDSLEEKITNMCKLSAPPFNTEEGAAGQLAAKTVKILASLPNVDCVLLGMRQPEYVVGTVPLAFGTPAIDQEVALNAFRSVHNTICMWYATAIHEADHGTSKDWRLPVNEGYRQVGGAAAKA